MNECSRCKRHYPTPEFIDKAKVCIICRHLEKKQNELFNRVHTPTNNGV